MVKQVCLYIFKNNALQFSERRQNDKIWNIFSKGTQMKLNEVSSLRSQSSETLESWVFIPLWVVERLLKVYNLPFSVKTNKRIHLANSASIQSKEQNWTEFKRGH